MAGVVKKYLSQTNLHPASVRWSEACDCVQQTPDGGATWTDNPAADPRHADGFRQPIPGTTTQCDAAARMVNWLHDWVDGAISTVGFVQTANAILAIITVLTGGAGVLIELVWVVVEALLAIGQTVIDEAMTETVYADLLCIFFENISADGSMTAAQATTIQDLTGSQIGGVASVVVGLAFQLVGEVGFSNAAAQRSDMGDCADCGWCLYIDFRASDGDFVGGWNEPSYTGTWVDGVGWQADSLLPAGQYLTNASLAITLASDTVIESIQQWATPKSAGYYGVVGVCTTLDTTGHPPGFQGYSDATTILESSVVYPVGYSVPGGAYLVFFWTGSSPASVVSEWVIRGSGTPPTISSAVPC